MFTGFSIRQFFPVGIMLVLTFFMYSCNVKEEAVVDKPSIQSKHGALFDAAITETMSCYFQLKNALVDADATQAKNKTEEFVVSLDLVETIIKKSDSTDTLRLTLTAIDSILHSSERLIAVSDRNYELQRVYFRSISQQLLLFLKQISARSGQVYIFKCPISFNETGAEWLSASSQVRNPYFGSKMLTSGVLIDTL